MKDSIWILIFVATLGLLMIAGFDKVLENQDIMLCESAFISKNQEYLIKCECFYQGGDIKCLQK